MRGIHAKSWLMLTVVVAVTVAVSDIVVGPDTSLVGAMLLCPLLAATRLDGTQAAVACGTGLLLAFAVAAYEHTLVRPDQWIRLGVLASAAAYGVWAAGQRAARVRELSDVASTAQRAILQPTSFRLDGTAVCARYRSAAPQAVIGGDLYAFARTPHGLRMVIGDVRGKGLAAVRLSAAAIGHFRDCAYTHASLASVVKEMDQRLAGDLGEEDFITAAVAEFTPGRLRLANCGHHSPLHLPADGPPALLDPQEAATPIGLQPDPEVQQFNLAPGDRLLFYTDGVAEARDPSGAMFKMRNVIQPCVLPDLDDALDGVLAAMSRHTRAAQDDDVALVLVEPATAVPQQRNERRRALDHAVFRTSRASS
ncbi:PP2C family protein-serine/threonine phosphatase [Streptomyces sp. MST-110588]|uniref:PP2C family protein-serine/threonine phosphatase n=1 Tax=Streptomyces sp. MST-110588 TaxID=2833628 RepID=UPI001F5D672F|nr:PP2C family protein-serine/threonine phosphatase [Streptomyces sp. MST-110588]UNO38532.1 serine/threonine-protein phosphatase [Streptomyces sp. MST-110588]